MSNYSHVYNLSIIYNLSSILLCVILLFVILLFIFTYHVATKIVTKRQHSHTEHEYHPVDQNIIQDIKQDFDEAYHKMPDEYLDQKVDHVHDIQRLSSSTSSSSRRRSSVEAIDTMIGMMVNPEAYQKQRRQSMDVQDAISFFKGEKRGSSIFSIGDESQRRSSSDGVDLSAEAFSSNRITRRRSSVFGGMGRRSSFLVLSEEKAEKRSEDWLEDPFTEGSTRRTIKRRSSAFNLCTTMTDKNTTGGPNRSISFPE